MLEKYRKGQNFSCSKASEIRFLFLFFLFCKADGKEGKKEVFVLCFCNLGKITGH